MKFFPLIVGFIFIVSFGSVFAKEPEFIFSWQAQTTTPQWYEGKAFPSYGSDIDVSFEIVEQNGSLKGNFIDISNKEVRWYINDEFVKKGNGLQHVRIKNKDYPYETLSVRVSVVDYYDSELGRSYNINHHESIPIVAPHVVGDYHKFTPDVLPSEKISLSIYPFFFNIDPDALKVSWKVNNEIVSINPDSKYNLDISIPDSDEIRGRIFPVEVSVNQEGSLFSSGTFYEQFRIR